MHRITADSHRTRTGATCPLCRAPVLFFRGVQWFNPTSATKVEEGGGGEGGGEGSGGIWLPPGAINA